MITLTELAAGKIKQHLNHRGQGVGIRIAVKTTGCSGLAYVLEFADRAVEQDIKLECAGCTIFVDPKACPYVEGMTIDYVRNGLNEGFDFKNPNERDRCGCGSSFRI